MNAAEYKLRSEIAHRGRQLVGPGANGSARVLLHHVKFGASMEWRVDFVVTNTVETSSALPGNPEEWRVA